MTTWLIFFFRKLGEAAVAEATYFPLQYTAQATPLDFTTVAGPADFTTQAKPLDFTANTRR